MWGRGGGGLYIFFPIPSGLQEFFNSNNNNNINNNNFICISFYKIYSLYKVEGMALYFEFFFYKLKSKDVRRDAQGLNKP